MKVSYNWIKEYIKTDLPAHKAAEILTDIGLEVEGIESFESIKGGLQGIVVGEVKTCEKHPDADRLSVTKVDVGESELLDIVCGAPNVAAGQKVLVATIGTKLYDGDNTFTIKRSKIRGVESKGMICAEDELGLGDSHDGIIVLDDNVKVGYPATKYFPVETDTLFEIGLTPNRVDGSSHIGVARDLAAFLKLNGDVEVTKPDVESFKIDSNDNPIKVTIENTDACPRYAGVSISNVEIKESLAWLKSKLTSIGLSPINNVVDITNFVLHETGQPLHAFDADKLEGKEIIVKNLKEGTKFTTLDEVERSLSVDDLVICDAKKGVALAGVFGGLESGVTDSTKNIFLESAYFNPVSIRRTAKKHTLSTDSSFRFERGIDPNGTIYALKRAALLIKEIAGGKISSEVVDIYPKPIEAFNVSVSYKNISRLIGKKIDSTTIKNILLALEMKILKEDDMGLDLEIPPYRVDVQREADVIEDILRIYGYNNIEISSKVNSTITYKEKPNKDKIINLISNYLSSNGFNEIWSNSLTKSRYYENNEGDKNEKIVYIHNPLSADLNCMRSSLLYGGLETVLYNSNRQNPNNRFYEFGNTYYKKNDPLQEGKAENYSEELHFAMFISGKKNDPNWISREEKTSYFMLKSYVDNILSLLNISSIKQKERDYKMLGAGLSYYVKKELLVEFGLVNRSILKDFGIDTDVFYADFNWDVLIKAYSKNKVQYKELPKFPEVRRDLALLLDKDITFKQIKDIAFNTEKEFLKQLILFDVYEGKNIEEGKKSYAIGFTLQSEHKTLADKQIDKVMNKMINAYTSQLNAKIR